MNSTLYTVRDKTIKSVTINYNCQDDVNADGFKGLTKEEINSLKMIVNKLYHTGIKLKLTFTERVNEVSNEEYEKYLQD